MGSGLARLVAIGLGILFILLGIGLALLNGLILGSLSGFNGATQAVGIAQFESFGLVAVGLVSIVVGFFMLRNEEAI